MKKFSKVLCLVLCLAMMAGLCCFGTGAAFKDADKITYKEAAAVMEATGIMVGDENGFRPQDGLTRAEACVIITKLCDATSIKGTCAFTDVKGHWAEQYIAYCAAEGYVSGYDAKTFGPDDALTGSAWSLMLLRVLGYDPACEGIGGDTWEIGVAKLVKKLDLSKTLSNYDATANITREVAAEFTLKALQGTMVEYEDKGTSIKINGAEITTSGKAANDVASKSESYKAAIGDTDTIQLGEQLFQGKLTYAAAATGDAFGRTAKTWSYKGKEIGTYTTLEADYTATVTDKTAFTSTRAGSSYTTDELTAIGTKLDKVMGITATNKKLTSIDEQEFYINGVAVADNDIVTLNAGDQVEVYLVDGSNTDVAKVIVLRQSYAKILDVKENTGKAKAVKTDDNGDRIVYDYKITLDTDNDGSANITTNDVDLKGYTAEYVKGAYLNLYLKNSAVIGSSVAQTVTGAATAFTATKDAAIDGTTYKFANTAIPGFNNMGKTIDYKAGEYTVVLDDAGYAVAFIEKESNAPTLDNVVFALDSYWATSDTAYGTTKKVVYQQVVALDGTVSDIVVGGYTAGTSDSDAWGNVTISSGKATYTAVKGLAVKTKTAATKTVSEYFTLNASTDAASIDTSTNNYTFGAWADANGNGLTTTAKKFANAYLTADTTVILINKTAADAKTKATVYTGAIGYTPATTGEYYSYVTNTTSKGTEVVAIVYAGSDQSTANAETLYVKSASTTTNANGYAQTAYKMDGTKVDITVESGSVTGFVTYTVDGDGVYDLTAADKTVVPNATFDKNTAAHKDNFKAVKFVKSYYGDGYVTLKDASDNVLADIPADKAVVVDLRTASQKEANYDVAIESVADMIAAVDTYVVDSTTTYNTVTCQVKTNTDGAVVVFITAVGA